MAYTSCALTTGFDLDCRDAVGGVKSVRFANLDDYLALTPVVSAGAITSITATATFYKYEQLKETSSLTETINGNSQNGTVYYTPEMVVVLSKLDVNKRNEIKVLAQQRLVAIVETNDVYCMRTSNMFLGVDLDSDASSINAWFSPDSQKYRVAVDLTLGVQVAYPDQISAVIL